MEAIEAEVHKLIECCFIREEQHPDWVANIVLVLKKNKKIWICINYRDLNAAFPKYQLPLPITDIMIDNTCDFQRMSFMDGFSGYNRSRLPKRRKVYFISDTIGGILLYSYAFWVKECCSNLPTCNEYNLL